jgi:hypothetical protein
MTSSIHPRALTRSSRLHLVSLFLSNMTILAHNDDDHSRETASPTFSMSESMHSNVEKVGDIGTSPAVARRHEAYFIEDEHIQLEAGGAVFRIHSHFFIRESDEARVVVE